MSPNPKIVISAKDIKRVEDIFFNGNGSFEDEKGERYSFISCIDKSIDVEACPGSGKTTCLLAKLYLLSEKMPFENGKGICVLTHTNVAINEIKSRLGNKADRFFQYPNFFGTIQSFVDKYFAIPFYINKYKRRPNAIDSVRVATRFQNTYLDYSIKDKVGQVKYFLKANELFDKITYKRLDNGKYTLVKGIGGNQIEIKKPRSRTDWSDNEKAELFEILLKLRTRVFVENALLSYDDAYFLANEYLLEFPKIKLAVSARFSHVFIDEMQDTYSYQDAIIKAVFNQEIIIQRIGDSNQAILNDNNSESAWEHSERLKITGSRRFTQPIADVLKTVALIGDPELKGIGDGLIPPYIIRYQNGYEPEVFEKFVRLVHELGLDDDDAYKYPVKAVGWVGREKDGLTISSYFKPYTKYLVKSKSLDNLKSAILLCDSLDPKELYNVIIDCTLEILRLAGIKHATLKGERFHNKTSFLDLAKQDHPESLQALNTNISQWGKELNEGKPNEIIPAIRTFFKNTLFPELNVILNKKACEFIESEEIVEVSEDQIESKNIFRSANAHLKHIAVEVGTVHSVKGETHRATLYLETFFHKSCGEYLIDQLIGTPYDGKGGKRKEMCLRIAHVGMSRPTHLLCVALNKSLVDQKHQELEVKGWKII